MYLLRWPRKQKKLIGNWTKNGQSIAIDSFIGDIYSGLRANELSNEERAYADKTLWILSGLYGYLRPFDGISPYRLEMGYKFPDARFSNLYQFWGDVIANQLPKDGVIVNTSSVEYSQVITSFVEPKRVVTPEFLTLHPKTNQPTFMAVHAKIARGAFAKWLIQSKCTDPKEFYQFNDLGYVFQPNLSKPNAPVFVCKTFGGIGLSIRLTA